jgi:hypothetical protein
MHHRGKGDRRRCGPFLFRRNRCSCSHHLFDLSPAHLPRRKDTLRLRSFAVDGSFTSQCFVCFSSPSVSSSWYLLKRRRTTYAEKSSTRHPELSSTPSAMKSHRIRREARRRRLHHHHHRPPSRTSPHPLMNHRHHPTRRGMFSSSRP